MCVYSILFYKYHDAIVTVNPVSCIVLNREMSESLQPYLHGKTNLSLTNFKK